MKRVPSISTPKLTFAPKGKVTTINPNKAASTTRITSATKMSLLVGSSMRFSSVAQPISQEEILPRVVNVVTNFYKTDSSKPISLKTHFTNDLGLDSLDQVELVLALEDEFVIEVPDEAAEKIHTVEDAVKYIASTKVAK